MNLQKAEFLTSIATPAQIPSGGLAQIVFAGKSNVGKSSVINRVLQRKNFARVGEQPGKTIHINLFRIDEKVLFVDLPGYGYAKVPKPEKERWAKLLEAYFAKPDAIVLGILIVDARHAPTNNDITMAACFRQTGKPYLVVANKFDKLKKSEMQPNLQTIRDDLELPDEVKVLPFSAEKGEGRAELVAEIFRAIGE